ncbi:MAG: peptide chain release factor 3 [Fimbriimonadaceae bacterium]|nr:peptide chain release factor 3 [Fimbriimonadaceae bacterium]
MNSLQTEIARRRTFAIISHPDAGKTTLTEKLLLYGGALQLAGSVKAKGNQRRATSDWMELEKQRGISVTSTVLQFEYSGLMLNLLDTPGHNDFSADTYRTLTAADSAVMLIDNAKGVEAQTKKLFKVCRQRGIPIFTFVNKMDHEGIGPLDLLSEVEETLGIRSVPMNWPIGQGADFQGIYDRQTHAVHLYERTARGATTAGHKEYQLEDPEVKKTVGDRLYQQLLDEIELLNVAGEEIDLNQILAGQLTPVFFGSALTNFGVQQFLDQFIKIAPAPTERLSQDAAISPDNAFSGFVFKIQANMDPAHRDRIAFLRIVSGEFEKDMEVIHSRTGKTLKLNRPQKLFARDRETVETAFAGDIIGLTNPGAFRLGDTLSLDGVLKYEEVPAFKPEAFASIQSEDVARYKHFEKGVNQLSEEGLVDLFWDHRAQTRTPILGVIGKLQFDVVQFRLLSEYGVKTTIYPVPYTEIAWVTGPEKDIMNIFFGSENKLVKDNSGNYAILSISERQLDFIKLRNESLQFSESPP